MKTNEEIAKVAKKYYIEVDNRQVGYYLFIAKVHTQHIIHKEKKRYILHDILDLFWFNETDIEKAKTEFFRRLSFLKIEDRYKEIKLLCITKYNTYISTGLKVEL